MRLNRYFDDNIIAQAEFRHQRYIIETSRSGRGWIMLAVIMLAPAIIMSFVAVAYAITENEMDAIISVDPINNGYTTIEVFGTLGIVALVTMNIAMYIVIMLVTVGLSANSITREKLKNTWDVLLLTNVDSRRLVLGKWLASARALWGDHLMLALLRVGLVGVMISELFDNLQPGPFGLSAGLTHTLLLSLFVIAYTLLDAGLTVSMGVALPLTEMPGSVATGVIFSLRMFGMVFNLGFALLVLLMAVRGGPMYELIVASLLLGLGLNWAALKAAQYIAVRGQVSPPVG